MKTLELNNYLVNGHLDDLIKKITCLDNIENEKQRYLSLLKDANELYGDGDYHFVSSCGRSEIGGNHTDHQHGHVLACSLNIDNLAVCKANDSLLVNFIDRDFGTVKVDLNDLNIKEEEKNTSNALIRGIANKLVLEGYQIGGFDCLCDSKVLLGSGISSSACFEVMVVEIFNSLFNDNKIDSINRAKYAQYAENVYFGKPSGLLDQMAISVGGFVAIDFKDMNSLKIENYDFSFSDYDYDFILVNTKGDHANLSNEYAYITSEIKEVAKMLNVEYLADSSLKELLNNLSVIRTSVKNDRAILRSIHFFLEDQRAVEQKEAVKNKNIEGLLNLMNDSGNSSYKYLQNVNVSSRPYSQSLALALAISDTVLQNKGAVRVHGGGFEGTIQAIVPKHLSTEYQKCISKIFGDDAILLVKVRPVGTLTLI